MLTLFPNSRQDRLALAKAKYFEEGVLPTGLVAEPIFQSWMRCYRTGALPQDKVAFQPVSASRTHLAVQKNRALQQAWQGEQAMLLPAMQASSCSVVLTDPSGVLIGLTPSRQPEQRIIPVAHRMGVSLAEECVGTTAPGLVVRTGRAACVSGAEHYFNGVQSMYCAAAPIRGCDGQLAGILDISSEAQPFAFDPVSVVGTYAASIENRLLLSQAKNTWVVRFQFLPTLMNSPLAAILGLSPDGQVRWVNSVAHTLLKIPFDCAQTPLHVQEVFDLSLADLRARLGRAPSLQRLCNGLCVYFSAEAVCEDLGAGTRAASPPGANPTLLAPVASVAPAAPAPAPAPAEPVQLAAPMSAQVWASAAPQESLRDADAELIQRYLREYRGNLSLVAKRLKVSRGLVYRRIKALSINLSAYKAASNRPASLPSALPSTASAHPPQA